MAKNRISTGSFDFNKWLFGGYENDVITMIAGPPGSGKTNFCVLVACSQAKKDKKILFVDTEGGFSVERVKQIVGEGHEEILKNIIILSPTNFEEQKQSFVKVFPKIQKKSFDLIIVDGMAMLYRLELGDAVKSGEDERIKEVNREVARQMRMLAEVARKQKIPIIITNQVYGGFQSEEEWKQGKEREMNIVGGDLMKYWSKCIIELKAEGRKRKAILLKHRSMAQKELSFEIKDKGIFRRGWI
jgi:DNA repair protein RadB